MGEPPSTCGSLPHDGSQGSVQLSPPRLASHYRLFSVDSPPADGLSCWLTVHPLLAHTEFSPSERRAKGRTYESTLSGRLNPSGLVFDFSPKPRATAF